MLSISLNSIPLCFQVKRQPNFTMGEITMLLELILENKRAIMEKLNTKTTNKTKQDVSFVMNIVTLWVFLFLFFFLFYSVKSTISQILGGNNFNTPDILHFYIPFNSNISKYYPHTFFFLANNISSFILEF